MNRSYTFAIVLAACLSAGCVATVNPLYSKDCVVRDPAIEGIWFAEKDDGLQPRDDEREWQAFSISAAGEGNLFSNVAGAYKIVWDTPHSSTTYAAHLVELGGRRYLDVYAVEEKPLDVIPIHNVFRISLFKNQLALSALDKRKVQEILKLEEPDFPVSQIGQRLVFTASTAELQAFFAKYGDRVFGKEQILKKRPAKVAAE